jgi:sporulation protein YlmC with PRC-barrel domain
VHKVSILAAFAALLAAELSTAQAQTSAPLGQIRASKMLGSAVYSARDVKIGTVKDLVLDQDGKVAAVIVDVPFIGLGEKFVAVAMSDIGADGDRLTLELTRDQLQQMASYKLEREDDGTRAWTPDSGILSTITPPR